VVPLEIDLVGADDAHLSFSPPRHSHSARWLQKTPSWPADPSSQLPHRSLLRLQREKARALVEHRLPIARPKRIEAVSIRLASSPPVENLVKGAGFPQTPHTQHSKADRAVQPPVHWTPFNLLSLKER
jgi:hypothetical protein